MIQFALLSLPVFGVVALGWAAARTGLVDARAVEALSAFSFRFGLPALVAGLIAAQPIRQSFHPAFYAGYLAAGGLVFALVFGASRLLGHRRAAAERFVQPGPDAAARASVATVSNLGFLGLPLMLAFFGERAAGPLAMAVLAEVMVLMSVGGMLMSRAATGDGGRFWRGVLGNPVVVAIALGAVVAALGVTLPGPVAKFLAFLGGAAGPTALFALGGALAGLRIGRSTLLAASALTAAKLLFYPLVVWFTLGGLLGLDRFWVQAGVLLAALPSAGNVYAMASRYRADPDLVSAATALSTVVSVLTVPLAGWLVMG
ncbi:AEC family transporter [Pseudonocardia eucalypti]|uniref:AEC family transporter n=1 Tax=Pseudonocardia eucalypti TaxID=648755 RepID=A0ABP9QYH6_9PSEU|nr:putative permease [Pseudonocardia eucalypti]